MTPAWLSFHSMVTRRLLSHGLRYDAGVIVELGPKDPGERVFEDWIEAIQVLKRDADKRLE